MTIDRATVKKLGRLARLKIREDNEENMAQQVNGVMQWIEQLGELDTTGVEPMTGVSTMDLKKRADAVTDGNIQDQILANAPESKAGFFVVPKIVE